MRQIVTLTRSDAPNAFVHGAICALCVLVFLPVWSQSEFCLEGTVWDATLGGCIPLESCAVEGDFNGDGLVGSADLLAFLTLFGNQYQDSDGDGLCDALDGCNGVVDDCGVCNGPGAIYNCGCEECGPGFVECGDPLEYQGYDYETVLIGNQCWFAENLRAANYANGDVIPTHLNDNAWNGFGPTGDSTLIGVIAGDSIWVPTVGYIVGGAMAVYGDSGSTCMDNSPSGNACDESWSLDAYGRLYNWFAVDDARRLCPSGWHVPSDAEWIDMEMALGMSVEEANAWGMRGTDEGIQMSASSGWSDPFNGSNTSGFSALPGGERDGDGGFLEAGMVGAWWCSDEGIYPKPYRALGPFAVYEEESSIPGPVLRFTEEANVGMSVRCIQNNLNCANDADADGICDDEDDCVGALDACGVCNGPGAIYDCGCETCPPEEGGCGTPVYYQGYDYATVQIGDQCWFAENLRSENYENGDSIPSNLGVWEWMNHNTTIGAVAVYGEEGGECMNNVSFDFDPCDSDLSLSEYGRLYNWYAVDDARGLCPSGWHVPTNEEWNVMADYLGGDTIAGGQMKTTYGWYNGGNGTNSSGFSGLPGGLRDSDGGFYSALFYGFWWSSTAVSSNARCRYLSTTHLYEFTSHVTARQDGLSVRCVRDNLSCANDVDADGICDDEDDCVGALDACGVCNGPGAIYDCGCETCPPEEGDCGVPVSYQGHDYATVQIGNQCWFAENLRSENYQNGEAIPTNLSDSEWESATTGAASVYGEGSSSCPTNINSPDGDVCDEGWALNEYGRLYNWHAVNDSRHLCPSGWHVPSDGEWTTLTYFLGGNSVAGGQMKTDYGWYNAGEGSNASGFSGLPGGWRRLNGEFTGGGGWGIWWSSSSNGPLAWDRYIDYSSESAVLDSSAHGYGFSVRCIRDNVNCANDADADGICDDEDDCIGALDACGVCNGPGAIYDCGCETCPPEEGGCGAPVSYQGYDYATVQIGGQCWLAENLRNENYKNGDAIPSGLSDSDWETTTSGAVAVYGEEAGCYESSPDIDACDPAQSLNNYGRLYNWYAVDDPRGLCPSGWHVPSDGEWTVLSDHLGDESVAGGQMKTTYGWSNGGNGTNTSGFSGLPGGFRNPNGFFDYAGDYGSFWSSSPEGSSAWYRYLFVDVDGVYRYTYDLPYGFSVRCVQDPE